MNAIAAWKKIIWTGSALLLPMFAYPEFKLPEPAVFPESLVTVSIPDLHQTLDAVQHMADQILPEEAQLQVKAQLGQMLGDPGLEGIPAGSGMAVAWDGTAAYGVLECSPETAEKLSELTAGMQLLSVVQGNLLIVSKDPAGLEAGKNQAAAAAETLLKTQMTGVMVNLQSAKLVEKFRPQINFGIMMMTNMMTQNPAQLPDAQVKSMQSMAKIFEGEMRVLVSLASQIDHTEIRLLPQADAVEYAVTLSVREGTHMHALITAPDTVKPDPMITAAHLNPGMIAFEMFLGNPDALQTFIKAESDLLVKEMALDPALTAKWEKMMELWPVFISGSMAETVIMDPESGFSVEYMGSVQDPQKVLSTLETLPDLMKPFMSMYEEMGMPIEFDLKLNARKYGDASIHQYNFSYDLEKMDPVAAGQLRAMKMAEMQSELTVIGNRLLWTMGQSSLDALIDRISGAELPQNKLHAHEIYPDSGFYYYDMDLGKYFEFITSLMPKEQSPEMFGILTEHLKNTPPLTGAGFQQNNGVYFSNRVPLELIRQFVLMGYGVQVPAQNMQPIPAQPQ